MNPNAKHLGAFAIILLATYAAIITAAYVTQVPTELLSSGDCIAVNGNEFRSVSVCSRRR